MTVDKTHLAAELPVPEAADLVAESLRLGVSIQKYVGYHVLKSIYGALHPEVVAFGEAHLGNTREK
ncbi:hypothetical protein [Caballeronia sp. LZ035]|uniref:hypothetical protein n=1 Tax=Caballeronia sp. LZ035 TaxID=3038568 RepID=UPI00285EB405|nr:hypothetical protein [Caballeronia sp. LZ035]MDR5756997.1 hypothetical protein [Caballeronia sp. LZ035]